MSASKDDLRALFAKVQQGTGADRELDAEIMFDLFAVPVGRKDGEGPAGYLWPEDSPSWSFGIRFPGKNRAWFGKCRARIDGETLLIERDGAFVLMNSLRVPKLTASIDAAVALVERCLPGFGYLLRRHEMGQPGLRTCCSLLAPVDSKRDDTWSVSASTTPLAILAALLSALIDSPDTAAPGPVGDEQEGRDGK